jgi:hypothetical protein
MQYKVWRSRSDHELHLICREGADAFEALPIRVRDLRPWAGSKEVGHRRAAVALARDARRAGFCDRPLPREAFTEVERAERR